MNNYEDHFIAIQQIHDDGLLTYPDAHVLPQMFMRWAFWPHQWHPEVLGDEQHHRFRNLLGSTGGQGITVPLKSIKTKKKTKQKQKAKHEQIF